MRFWVSLAIAAFAPSSATADGIRILLTEDGTAEAPLSTAGGTTRWVIEGPDDFTLAEEHGGISEMAFDLPPGPYRVTVWYVDTGAAASGEAVVAPGETKIMTLEPSLSSADLVDAVMERLNSE